MSASSATRCDRAVGADTFCGEMDEHTKSADVPLMMRDTL